MFETSVHHDAVTAWRTAPRVSDTGQCEDVGDLDCLASGVAAPGRVFGGPSDGDCSGRVRYQGTLYRSHNELNQAAPLAEPLGGGDIVGCGGLGADAVDRVKVRAVRGVDPGIAVAIGGKKWRGVYVAVGVQKTSWPEVLRHR